MAVSVVWMVAPRAAMPKNSPIVIITGTTVLVSRAALAMVVLHVRSHVGRTTAPASSTAASAGHKEWGDLSPGAVPLTVVVFLLVDVVTKLVGQAYETSDVGLLRLLPALQSLLVAAAAASTMWHRPRLAVVLTANVVALDLVVGLCGTELWLVVITGVTVAARAGRGQIALVVLAQFGYAVAYGVLLERQHAGWAGAWLSWCWGWLRSASRSGRSPGGCCRPATTTGARQSTSSNASRPRSAASSGRVSPTSCSPSSVRAWPRSKASSRGCADRSPVAGTPGPGRLRPGRNRPTRPGSVLP